MSINAVEWHSLSCLQEELEELARAAVERAAQARAEAAAEQAAAEAAAAQRAADHERRQQARLTLSRVRDL